MSRKPHPSLEIIPNTAEPDKSEQVDSMEDHVILTQPPATLKKTQKESKKVKVEPPSPVVDVMDLSGEDSAKENKGYSMGSYPYVAL